jgi:hypothetical protein
VDTVQIINMALAEIGARARVSSINPSDGSAEGDVASLLYQTKIDDLHRAAHWNFAKFQGPLTLLKAAAGTPENPTGLVTLIPPRPWSYSYAYPSNCLKARYILPAMPTYGNGGIPFTTADNYAHPACNPNVAVRFSVGVDTDAGGNDVRAIFTNMSQAELVYTKRMTDPNLWDHSFIQAATSYMGAWFVNALARNAALHKDQMNIAAQVVAKARVSDGNEGPVVMDHTPDWISIRGAAPAGYNHGVFFYGWDYLATPSGGML